nr:cysteine proteinase inhibitor 5-like [Tanacetum cinerariifolium]
MTQSIHPRNLLVTLAFLAVLCSGGVCVAATRHLSDPVNGVGAWDHMEVKKHYLEELGEYAVQAYNLASLHDHEHELMFQKVIAYDHLSDIDHKLTIQAADHGVTHTYEAVVCDKPWIQVKKLVSFKRVVSEKLVIFLHLKLEVDDAVLSGGVYVAATRHLSDPVNGVGAWDHMDVKKHYLEELGEYAVQAYNLASVHDHEHELMFQK